MKYYYQKIEEASGEHSNKPPRHFPLLPGLLVLSAALHLCAAMVWPLNTELPSVGSAVA